MTKRAQCPKCHRDTWSEKWKACSACGEGYEQQLAGARIDEAKARADAAGDKRQSRSQERRIRKQKPPGAVLADMTVAVTPTEVPIKDFQPSAEELAEQADGPVGVVTSGSMRLRPLPGETCPTCNRKVPKRRLKNATPS